MWDGDIVLDFIQVSSYGNCSKPTVWDGDKFYLRITILMCYCSKPTVWDGDEERLVFKPIINIVLSPPCGMATKNS